MYVCSAITMNNRINVSVIHVSLYGKATTMTLHVNDEANIYRKQCLRDFFLLFLSLDFNESSTSSLLFLCIYNNRCFLYSDIIKKIYMEMGTFRDIQFKESIIHV